MTERSFVYVLDLEDDYDYLNSILDEYYDYDEEDNWVDEEEYIPSKRKHKSTSGENLFEEAEDVYLDC